MWNSTRKKLQIWVNFPFDMTVFKNFERRFWAFLQKQKQHRHHIQILLLTFCIDAHFTWTRLVPLGLWEIAFGFYCFKQHFNLLPWLIALCIVDATPNYYDYTHMRVKEGGNRNVFWEFMILISDTTSIDRILISMCWSIFVYLANTISQDNWKFDK